jgi:cell division protein FtsL
MQVAVAAATVQEQEQVHQEVRPQRVVEQVHQALQQELAAQLTLAVAAAVVAIGVLTTQEDLADLV